MVAVQGGGLGQETRVCIRARLVPPGAARCFLNFVTLDESGRVLYKGGDERVWAQPWECRWGVGSSRRSLQGVPGKVLRLLDRSETWPGRATANRVDTLERG